MLGTKETRADERAEIRDGDMLRETDSHLAWRSSARSAAAADNNDDTRGTRGAVGLLGGFGDCGLEFGRKLVGLPTYASTVFRAEGLSSRYC
jgi:hypothetical protein